MRSRLEEELLKMQDLTIFLESKLKSRTQELSLLRSEHEKTISELSRQVKIYQSKIDLARNENENLKQSIAGIKSDYFRATDSDISKASKIDELYLVIQDFQNESKQLRGEISKLQSQMAELTDDNSRLLQNLMSKKAEESTGVFPVRCSVEKRFSSSFKSLTKSRSQIWALQKAKSRIDTQIHLLSKFD